MFGKTRHIHIVGIGGASLSGIAEILLGLGFKVSGSDIKQSDRTDRVAGLGGIVLIGHSAEQIADADVVVVSPAIPNEDPEILAAKERKIPVIRGAEMLAEIMRMKYSIAISGTHGKTTTTAMTAAVLNELDPTVVVGGKLTSREGHARFGHSNFMVVEADEAYGSIKKFFPTIAVVTSIDADHLDYYDSVQEIGETFLEFINKIPFYGVAILCLDQPNIQKLIPKIEKRFISYGLKTRADVIAENIRIDGPSSIYEVRANGNLLGKIHLKMPGHHNISNSLAAVAAGLELGIEFAHIQSALASFEGVHRRFEIIGKHDDIIVVDDYAHNPAKLRATFNATRNSYPDRRIVAVFQPHRYGRVKHLSEDFARSFYQTDMLIVTKIYSAGEKSIKGVTAKKLAEAIRTHGHKDVTYIDDKDEIVEHLANIVEPGDIVITAGAGDVWKVGKELLEKIDLQ